MRHLADIRLYLVAVFRNYLVSCLDSAVAGNEDALSADLDSENCGGIVAAVLPYGWVNGVEDPEIGSCDRYPVTVAYDMRFFRKYRKIPIEFVKRA